MSRTAPDVESFATTARFVAVSGGVGGAKLAVGLAELLGDRLTVIVNTGDDFEHLGLHVSPDIDTALYTLADLVNPETGWGRRDETWSFMGAVEQLGGPTWFKLGDKDLAVHVERTRRLRGGESLSSVTAHLAGSFGVSPRIVPMSDSAVRTLVDTDAGTLAFQEYFVRERCAPPVRRISFEGANAARPAPDIATAVGSPELSGIILCPSNPWLSVDPVLAVPGLKDLLRSAGVPIVAVTPIIAGQAVKGPTAKIMRELGLELTARTIASHYAGLLDGFVLDTADAPIARNIPVETLVTNTLMHTRKDKVALARECIAFCERIAKRTHPASARQ